MEWKSGEHRLCRYESYTGRFFGAFKDRYDMSNPFQVLAAGTHAVTQFGGIDPMIRDAGRSFDGNKEAIKPLEGMFARTREDVFGAVGDIFSGHFGSAITKVINVVGDAVADGADLLVGVDGRKTAGYQVETRNDVQKVLVS